ncbi:MAG: hypothetical protein A2V50_02195 [Bacteroidetes bacterium RBG_19FT_COMBO_42_10]|nr:MAG: hypothetical protein A2V50_02195 [Bacteroidetes bacterium RBG_19FT_COMBO_42_10]OFY64184.1 MAG: hypothetical protein A2V64_06025 [Bacteroidetes bacterium RBG_13_43_22]
MKISKIAHKSNKNIGNKVEMMKMHKIKFGSPEVPKVLRVKLYCNFKYSKLWLTHNFIYIFDPLNINHFR